MYLSARYYDPSTGQFLTRDPLVASTRSAYGYVAGNPLSSIDPTGLSSKGAAGSDGTHISGIDGCEHPNSERLQIGPGIFRPSNWFSMTWKEKLHWIRVHDTNRIKLVDDSYGAAFWNDGFTTSNVLRGVSYGAGAIAVFASGGTVVAVAGGVSVVAGVGAEAADDGPCRGERVTRAAALGTLGAATAGAFIAGGMEITGRVAGGAVLSANGMKIQC